MPQLSECLVGVGETLGGGIAGRSPARTDTSGWSPIRRRREALPRISAPGEGDRTEPDLYRVGSMSSCRGSSQIRGMRGDDAGEASCQGFQLVDQLGWFEDGEVRSEGRQVHR